MDCFNLLSPCGMLMTNGSKWGDKDGIRLIVMQHIAGYGMSSCDIQLFVVWVAPRGAG
jgi:hypothetical protein